MMEVPMATKKKTTTKKTPTKRVTRKGTAGRAKKGTASDVPKISSELWMERYISIREFLDTSWPIVLSRL